MSFTKNEDGTYQVVLGIAEGRRADGLFFPRELVEKEIQRFNAARLPLIAEMEHPHVEAGTSAMVRHARLLDIHHERACGYLTDFVIQEGDQPMITAKYTPRGKYANIAVTLIDDLAPVKFGMRALSHDLSKDGEVIRTAVKIITWDLINGE